MPFPDHFALNIVLMLAAVLSAAVIVALGLLGSHAVRSGGHALLGCLLMPLVGLVSLIAIAALKPFWAIVLFLIIFIIIDVVRRRRAMRQHALLWLLTASAERSMPLGAAAEAFCHEFGGSFGWRARQLAEMLNSGVPLADALERCPGLLPRYAAPMIHVGCETNTLPEALRRAASVHDLNEPIWMALQGKISYLVFLPVFAVGLLAYVVTYIVPCYVRIFQDFSMRLPYITQWLIEMSHLAADFWFAFVPILLLGPALLFYLPVRFFGWTDWDIPGMGLFTRRLDSAEILDALALVARQQQPMSQGVAALARSYPKGHIRARLTQAATDIMAGRDWCQSLHAHGLIRRPEMAILLTAQRVGNLSWALNELADGARRRLTYRVQALAQLLFPAAVLTVGAVVLFVVAALFIPLVSLIDSLAWCHP